ncbi:hypothetical protein DLL90_20975 [Salmonella enterica subsp. enterica serovar Arechavaleta]|nr:hypothetical protein [Salmonella enterica subsp. enterica serovar Arechavaleta]EAW0407601.1 hypothetical protein [Salmonella enterica]EBF8684663.1 hypothetical protein [Salmonella enterica subsp. enterica]EDB4403731.1 hypothetical protein [Salmonella enterica subsp. enterica serovar Schwarzengrund]EAW4507378.1 hypothetical protein [Salmonella enterica]
MNIIRKFLGGLKGCDYFRHFFFGTVISFIFFYISIHSANRLDLGLIIIFIINTILYPYARFLYLQIIGFILGENIFILNAIVMLTAKVMTMFLCWIFSILIAPLGLAYLFYRNWKAEHQ